MSQERARLWYRARNTTALGAAIQTARHEAGFNQDELAERANTSRPTVSRLERGQVVTTTTLLDTAAACGYEIILVPRGARIHVED